MHCRYLEKYAAEYIMRLKTIRERMQQNVPGVFLMYDACLAFF